MPRRKPARRPRPERLIVPPLTDAARERLHRPTAPVEVIRGVPIYDLRDGRPAAGN